MPLVSNWLDVEDVQELTVVSLKEANKTFVVFSDEQGQELCVWDEKTNIFQSLREHKLVHHKCKNKVLVIPKDLELECSAGGFKKGSLFSFFCSPSLFFISPLFVFTSKGAPKRKVIRVLQRERRTSKSKC